MTFRALFRKSIAVPGDHGSWVFLAGPLIIGWAAGGRWNRAILELTCAALAVFLIRQPLSIAVRAYAGRRSRADLPAAWFWTGVYAVLVSGAVAGLTVRGFGSVLYLAIPGIPVFAWHLVLVARRDERQQVLLNVLAAGALALAAPAAYWVSRGDTDPSGWMLWLLVWAQSSVSIVHVQHRLVQRGWKTVPGGRERFRCALPSVSVASTVLAGVVPLGVLDVTGPWLFLPFAVQWAETILGTLAPAVGSKPRAIGLRQLAVSALFTILFVMAW